MLAMWETNPELVLAAAGFLVLCLLAVYAYSALSPPKSIFQKPTRHAEIKSFRKMK